MIQMHQPMRRDHAAADMDGVEILPLTVFAGAAKIMDHVSTLNTGYIKNIPPPFHKTRLLDNELRRTYILYILSHTYYGLQKALRYHQLIFGKCIRVFISKDIN